MTHLNCKTVGQRDFSRLFGTLLVTWRQREEILSPAHPKTEYVFTPQNKSMLCLFFASSNVSFGLIREALHRFNGCAKIWSAPGTLILWCKLMGKKVKLHFLHSRSSVWEVNLCMHDLLIRSRTWSVDWVCGHIFLIPIHYIHGFIQTYISQVHWEQDFCWCD